MRASGILLPVSSLPSPYGIGCFSRSAYDFVDFLQEAGQRYWQILPLGPTGYGDSPYQSFSVFAGNPYFIDLDSFVCAGLLTKEECQAYDAGDGTPYVNYERLYELRSVILRKAYERSGEKTSGDPAYAKFCEENSGWLDDYCLYMAVKDHFGGVSWQEWEPDIRMHRPEAVKEYARCLADEVGFYRFQQYWFQRQWMELKQYANDRGIRIIGDIPIYVALDSADTWAHPRLFQFGEDGIPRAVAGCPPDGFSAIGQVWGNPLYDWEYHRSTGYRWWMERMKRCFRLYDVVRVDHFRGFDEYFSIPYGDATAAGGHWEKGPGLELFHVLRETLGDVRIIAEDLGFVTDSVTRLVEDSGYPGMKVLEFAFDSREESNYFPYTYTRNCVAYTGTHDNQTVVGWFRTLPEEERKLAMDYLGIEKGEENQIHWAMIRAVLGSVADTAVIPLQDYLGLDDSARINTPSSLGENWKWRAGEDQLSAGLARRILHLTKTYGR